MPNVKIFVDETLYPACQPALRAALGPLRDMLCKELQVDFAACQLAVLPVDGLPDQPPVNVELSILPRPERTRALILSVCGQVRALLGQATGAHVAVRVTSLDPETYIALK